MLFVDPTGEQNIIYVMAAGNVNEKQLDELIVRINNAFETLNLETRVQKYAGDNFDAKNLDETDNWAVVGNDRQAIAKKVKSITDSNFKGHVQDWANTNGDKEPEVSNGQIGGKGIAVDLSRGNIGTQPENSKPDSEGGSAIAVMHGGGHSSNVIQGEYGRRGLGDREGHTHTGVMTYGQNLVSTFNKSGAQGILNEDNSMYIKAMKQRYGSEPSRDNYQRNQMINDFIKNQKWIPKR